MRIIVFGGAGDMGSQAVEDLAQDKEVERLTIAGDAGPPGQLVAEGVGCLVTCVSEGELAVDGVAEPLMRVRSEDERLGDLNVADAGAEGDGRLSVGVVEGDVFRGRADGGPLERLAVDA